MTTTESIDELFARTLLGDYEDDAPWEAVRALRRLGSREIFERAAEWCKSDDALRRARGLDVLAQFGKTVEHRTNSFPDEVYSITSKAVQIEKEIRPLASAIAALGHLDDVRAVPLITPFAAHPTPEIRFAAACALGSFPNDERSAAAMLALTDDSDEDVRNWATFGLGNLGDLDSPGIREAFVRRLGDSNREVREEAMAGLGKRRDERVMPVLLNALEEVKVSDCVIEAAYLMLGMKGEREGWTGSNYAAALREQFGVAK